MIAVDHLPAEIRDSTRAVLWNREVRNGKPTKVPYVPSQPGDLAAVDDPATWGTFAEAYSAWLDGKADGVGVVLGDGLVGIDIDKCRDPQTGAIDAEALGIIREINSYTEISPSGTGIHILAKGTLPPGRRRRGRIEMYSEGRYFTLTGHHHHGTSPTIQESKDRLTALHARLFSRNGPATPKASAVSDDDTTLLTRARNAHNGEKFSRLWAGDGSGYPSPSEADLALCSSLAFWMGKDASRIDRVFRQSGRMRDKWDEQRGEQTYGQRTIARAIAECRESYHGDGTGTARQQGPVTVEHLTDLGNARRLVARHGQDLRYCFAWKTWLAWDGRRWQRDDSGEAFRRAKDMVRGIYAEASACADEDQRKAIAKHAARCEADSKVRALLSMAVSEPELVVRPEQLDRDAWLFTVENGTLDLRTGELRSHQRQDLITKRAPVAYDPEATAPTWEAFLTRIFNKDTETIGFVQRAVGYSLTGSTREQCWFLLHGSGSNGKSTLLRTLTVLLADYAVWTPAQTLLAKRGEHIENDLARLLGARLVGSIEPEGGRRLAEALVKQLTGGDPVTARFLYSEYFSFIPEAKLWFGTNHRPEIRGTDHAVWRRIRLIPFIVTIPDKEQDKDLPEKLRAEFPGILRWAVQGCLAWQQDGLGWAKNVREATAEYRASMDVVGAFLAECCDVDASASAGAGSLYRAYVSWSERMKEQAESQRRFGESLGERGFIRDRDTKTGLVLWHGLRLRTEGSEGSEPNSRKVF